MALDRLTPTTGPKTGSAYATEVQEEVTGLWDRVVITLTSVSGTNTITATATPALTGSLLNGMMFVLKAAATNTSTVTLNINSGGAVDVVDGEGTALTAGALRNGGSYLLKYDSTLTKFVMVGYFPAANVPVGLKLLSSAVVTSAVNSIDFFNGAAPTAPGGVGSITTYGSVVIDDTYDQYQFEISSWVPTTDDTEVQVLIGTGSTPTYQTTTYQWSTINTQAGSANVTSSSSDSKMTACTSAAGGKVGNASGENYSATIKFSNPEVTTTRCMFWWNGSYIRAQDGTHSPFQGGGFWGTATAITAVRFKTSSGTLAQGRISLYGLTKTS